MMMKNEVYYQELREKSEQMRNAISEDADFALKLVDSARAVLRLSETARKEGLLSLEEAAENGMLDDLILGEELKRMILLIVDGTEPEIVEDISFSRYFVQNYQGIEGFLYLMYIDFVLEIQAGTHYFVLWKLMTSFMPKLVCEELERMRDEERGNTKKTNEQKWEALYEKKLPVPDSPEGIATALVDYCITNMSDDHVKRTIDEISDYDLSYSMVLLSGAAYKKLHDNLDEDRREKVIEEKGYIGPCRFRDIGTTNSKIFQIILKLDKAGDIDVPGNLDQIFIADDKVVWQESQVSDGFLGDLFRGMTNADIQKVLKYVPQDTLSAAMKGWGPGLRRIICGNLPLPAAGIVTRDMERIDYREEEIREANEKILNVIRKLEDGAEIFIRGV